jgi:hypothetical protein
MRRGRGARAGRRWAAHGTGNKSTNRLDTGYVCARPEVGTNGRRLGRLFTWRDGDGESKEGTWSDRPCRRDYVSKDRNAAGAGGPHRRAARNRTSSRTQPPWAMQNERLPLCRARATIDPDRPDRADLTGFGVFRPSPCPPPGGKPTTGVRTAPYVRTHTKPTSYY